MKRMDREKIIKAIETHTNTFVGCYGCAYNNDPVCMTRLLTDVLAILKEQEAKIGHWIDSAGNDKCSICGEEYSDLYPDYGNTHFCPNCGAKMEGR